MPTESWVASSLFMGCCKDDGIHVVREGSLTSYTDSGKLETPLSSDDQYERLVADLFELPGLPIVAANDLGDAAKKIVAEVKQAA